MKFVMFPWLACFMCFVWLDWSFAAPLQSGPADTSLYQKIPGVDSIVIENYAGDVEIIGWGDPVLSVRNSDPGQPVPPLAVFSEAGNQKYRRLVICSDAEACFKQSLIIQLPTYVSLAVKGYRGNVTIRDIRGDVNLKLEAQLEPDPHKTERWTQGKIREQKGKFQTNILSNVTITNVRNLTATLDRGSLSVSGVGKNAVVSTGFGNLTLADVAGNVQAKVAEKGDISVLRSGGCEVFTNAGNVLVDTVGEAEVAQIGTRAGWIRAANLQGDYTIDNNRGDVQVMRSTGEQVIRAGAGNVTVSQLNGNLQVDGSQGDVELSCIQGGIDVKIKEGIVRIADCPAPFISVVTLRGNIEFTGDVPEKGRCHLRTVFGNVIANFWSKPTALKARIQVDPSRLVDQFSNDRSRSVVPPTTTSGESAEIELESKQGSVSVLRTRKPTSLCFGFEVQR
ncbi:MAG: DUF4097 domain-containing protein [Blastocatellia bacterium]|nr:DUF4097 domain-containing protein [Blastocatellia bacterium]